MEAAVEKVLDIPAIDMTDGGSQGKAEAASPEVVEPAPKAQPKKRTQRPDTSRETTKRTTKTAQAAKAARQPTGKTASPRRRRRVASTPPATDIDVLAASVVSSIQDLAVAMAAQSREVTELRERLDGVRQLLD